jgi:hypothetical protein
MLTFVFVMAFNCGIHFQYNWGSRYDLITYCGNGLRKEEGLYVSEFITNFLLVVLPLPTVSAIVAVQAPSNSAARFGNFIWIGGENLAEPGYCFWLLCKLLASSILNVCC